MSELEGNRSWVLTLAGYARRVVQVSAAGTVVADFGPIYDDGTYQYFGEAAVGSALAAAVWQVSRVHKTTGREEFLDSGNYSQVYTDLATVAGLFV